MIARDVMTTRVVTVGPETYVSDIARSLLEHHISAVPVVDDDGNVMGIVSEGDLMRRSEMDTARAASWWLALVSSPEQRALDYIKSHGRRAKEVMTSKVYSVDEDTALDEVAEMLERHRIKRVPVVREGRLVGIVSRANLLQGLATHGEGIEGDVADAAIREAIVSALDREAGIRDDFVNVTVSDGTVHLWGVLLSAAERQAARLVVENTDGVRAIEDHLSVLPPQVRASLWAE